MAITQERLKELLRYDPETGAFTWLTTTSNRVQVGDLAGSATDRYVLISIGGVKYRAHHLAWLYMTGSLPSERIDHRNLNKTDNRWSNLREATHMENSYNTAIRADNKSGAKGICWDVNRNRWLAFINAGGKRLNLGRFADFEEAKRVVAEARERLHGEFACHGG